MSESNKSSGLGTLVALVTFIAVLASGVTTVLYQKVTAGTKPQSEVVVLDANRIMRAKLGEVLTLNPTKAEEKTQAAKFGQDLITILQRYVDAGYIILLSNSVAKAPPGRDITQDVANELGVDLKKAELAPNQKAGP